MFDIDFILYRCDGQNDDPFRACFGCEEDLERKHFFNKYTNNKNNFSYNFIDRQTGERFRVTRRSRRLICSNRINRRSCRLRIDRAMELRDVTYMRALQSIQAEEYLSADDIDLIRYRFV